MSHLVTVKTDITSPKAAQAAGRKLGVEVKVAADGSELTETLYSGPTKGRMSLSLKGWKYPVVVKEDGTAVYDNYNGSWGEQARLDEFHQSYAGEVGREKMRSQGWRVQEEKVEQDGTLQLVFVQ